MRHAQRALTGAAVSFRSSPAPPGPTSPPCLRLPVRGPRRSLVTHVGHRRGGKAPAGAQTPRGQRFRLASANAHVRLGASRWARSPAPAARCFPPARHPCTPSRIEGLHIPPPGAGRAEGAEARAGGARVRAGPRASATEKTHPSDAAHAASPATLAVICSAKVGASEASSSAGGAASSGGASSAIARATTSKGASATNLIFINNDKK